MINRAIALNLDRAALVVSWQAALPPLTAQIAGEALDLRRTSLSNLLKILSLPHTLTSCLSFAHNCSKHGSQGRRKETRTACQEGSRKEVKRWQEKGFQEGRGKLQDLHLQGNDPTDLDVVPAVVVGRL